jgi:BTB/POZ domain
MVRGWADSSSDEEEEHNRPAPAVATTSNIPTAVASLEEKTTTSRSTESLWAELQQLQQNDLATLQRQRAELEQEKASMNMLATDASDIVAINVGGELILQAHRDTLCLAAPGSRFAALFSGRWEDHCVKDAQGRIFLDHDPELVRMIVNFMRIKRVEDPAAPLDPPTAQESKCQEWFCLLDHYGLTAFFTKPFSPLDVSSLTVIEKPYGSNVSTHLVGQGLQVSYDGPSKEHHFVGFTPRLVPGTQSSWKVTINKLPIGGLVYLGVIGNANAAQTSHTDPTGFGWTSSKNKIVHVAGGDKPGAGGWTGFLEGECLHFCLAENKLTMFSVTKAIRFVIDPVPAAGEKFIHFNFHQNGTKLTLEPLDATDYVKLVA